MADEIGNACCHVCVNAISHATGTIANAYAFWIREILDESCEHLEPIKNDAGRKSSFFGHCTVAQKTLFLPKRKKLKHMKNKQNQHTNHVLTMRWPHVMFANGRARPWCLHHGVVEDAAVVQE